MTDNFTTEEIKQRCLENYADFCALMQDDGWFDPNHKRLCDWIQYWYAQDAAEDIDCLLMIVLPRGALKSTIVTKYFSTWLTLREFYLSGDCSIRTLIATNTATNGTNKLRDIKGLFDNHALFRSVFPEVLPRKNIEQWSTAGLEINQSKSTSSAPEATFMSAGVGTRLTGTHYNIIIEDDTTAPDESDMEAELTIPSKETIDKAIGFHKAAVPLLVPKGMRISIIVTTRWADEDLVDYLNKHEDYRIFNLPAIQLIKAPDGEVAKEFTFPSFYTAKRLIQIEKRVGEYMFSCLYLNVPLDPSRRIFRKEWFIYTPIKDVPARGFCTVAIDPAISEDTEACESAITAIQHVQVAEGKDPNELPVGQKVNVENHQYWWKDVHDQMLPSEQVNTVIRIAVWLQNNVAPVKAIIVEKIAYQAALKFLIEDELKRRGLYFKVIGYGSKKSKHMRIESLQPHFMNKRIHFVENQLTDQVESQLLQFPHGKLIDIIDSFTLHAPFWKYEKIINDTKLPPLKTEADEILDFINSRRKVTGARGYDEFEFMNYGMKTGLGAEQDMAHIVSMI